MDNAETWTRLGPFERDFPVTPQPFAAMGHHLGMAEPQVLALIQRGMADGVIARVGATLRPHALGHSTLAALAVAPDRLTEVALFVSSFDEVNHNYEREGRYNLWFVVTARSQADVTAVLDTIALYAGQRPLDLPITAAFRIDLGLAR